MYYFHCEQHPMRYMGSPTDTIISVPDEKQSARKAGLRYVIPKGPGIRRRHSGSGFTYLDASDNTIHDAETIKRIHSLVIPPAWTSVWISPDPDSHIQAVGRDARGRKQYRYHPAYRRIRDLVKFDRMRAFGRPSLEFAASSAAIWLDEVCPSGRFSPLL